MLLSSQSLFCVHRTVGVLAPAEQLPVEVPVFRGLLLHGSLFPDWHPIVAM
jgi:hypothetical protein